MAEPNNTCIIKTAEVWEIFLKKKMFSTILEVKNMAFTVFRTHISQKNWNLMLEQNGVEKSYSTPFSRMQGGSVFFLAIN